MSDERDFSDTRANREAAANERIKNGLAKLVADLEAELSLSATTSADREPPRPAPRQTASNGLAPTFTQAGEDNPMDTASEESDESGAGYETVPTVRPGATTVYAVRVGPGARWAATSDMERVRQRLRAKFGNGYELLADVPITSDHHGIGILIHAHDKLKEHALQDGSYNAQAVKAYITQYLATHATF